MHEAPLRFFGSHLLLHKTTSLSALTYVDLSHNFITGGLAAVFAPALVFLDVGYNLFSGTYPIHLLQFVLFYLTILLYLQRMLLSPFHQLLLT